MSETSFMSEIPKSNVRNVDMSDVWEVDNRGTDNHHTNNGVNHDTMIDNFDENWDSLLNVREISTTEKNLEAQRKIELEKQLNSLNKKKVETEAEIKRKADLVTRQRKREAQKKKFQPPQSLRQKRQNPDNYSDDINSDSNDESYDEEYVDYDKFY